MLMEKPRLVKYHSFFNMMSTQYKKEKYVNTGVYEVILRAKQLACSFTLAFISGGVHV